MRTATPASPTRLAAAIALAAALAALPAAARADVTLVDGEAMDVSASGLFQWDATAFHEDARPLPGAQDHLRRAELVFRGRAERWDWTAGYDVDADRWLDVNVRVQLGDATRLRIGQFKQPLTLEEAQSSSHLDFNGRASLNAFSLSRRLGLGLQHAGEGWALEASAYTDDMNNGGAEGEGVAARALWIPRAEAGRVVQVGMSGSVQAPEDDRLALSSRVGIDRLPYRPVSTGSISGVERDQRLGVEGLWIAGPLSVQGEAMRVQLDRAGLPGVAGHAAYVYATWTLGDGGSRGWRDGVPSSPPTGRWMLTGRLGTIDLDDGAVRGGRADDVTVGLNWYAAAWLRFSLDHVRVSSERQGLSDDLSATTLRTQITF